jgi:redox-sensitive bicupin YhaK (pirin superfamily)
MRKILGIYSSPDRHWVGDGFPVRSLFSHYTHGQSISPFLLLDYAGPARFDPTDSRRGVGEHPHRGFETVTIVYQGALEHRDSAGNGGRIGPGDVQWMTAASGILHEEFHSQEFGRTGGMLEMAQLWVNLPAKDKMASPGYQTLLDGDIPSVPLPGGAGVLRVIAGSYGGKAGPAHTFTPMNVWDLRLRAGGEATLALPDAHTLIVVVLDGTVLVGGEQVAREGQTILFAPDGGDVAIEANNDAKLLVLSGEPIDEPIAAQGPFVMNTQGEIRQAIDDFRAGRFGRMPASR